MSKEKFLDAFHKLDPAVRPELRKYIGELEYLYDLAFRNGQRNMCKAAQSTAWATALNCGEGYPAMMVADRVGAAVNSLEKDLV